MCPEGFDNYLLECPLFPLYKNLSLSRLDKAQIACCREKVSDKNSQIKCHAKTQSEATRIQLRVRSTGRSRRSALVYIEYKPVNSCCATF